MGKYKVKRGYKADLDKAMREAFKSYETRGGRYFAKYGALEIEAYLVGKELEAKVLSHRVNDNEILSKSIKAYNKFLEEATGYTAKERRKKLMKEAKTEL
jgi:hypothetical protein